MAGHKEHRRVMSAGTLVGDDVYNMEGEDLGKVDEIMLDVETGQVAYVVLASGGVLGLGGKLFAIPWQALRLDEENHRFILNVSKEKLENAPGFDKDNWPDMTAQQFTDQMKAYYDLSAYKNL